MANENSKSKAIVTKKGKAKKLLKSSLIALEGESSSPADVSFTFNGGIGQATASLFRKGLLINMQSISSSGSIHLAEVQTGDVISINGVCTGTANVSINVSTTPATPEHFSTGLILAAYLIN
jgi:hypothetical protein